MSKIAKACVLVSRDVFNKYYKSLLNKSDQHIIFTANPSQNKFTFSQIFDVDVSQHNFLFSKNYESVYAVTNVTEQALSVYKMAKRDEMKCADDIVIKNISIEDNPMIPDSGNCLETEQNKQMSKERNEWAYGMIIYPH